MKKNLLKIYESFFDDLDKLNKDKENDEFSDLNNEIYDEHDFILSPYKNPEFFKSLCKMCKDFNYNLPSNENGFTQEDLDQITFINTFFYMSYFQNVTSLNELQYFHNLKYIYSYSFSNCPKLKSIKFPKNLEEIFEFSFYFTSLEEIILPENIKKISNTAFYDCSSLKKIIIPKRFKSLMKNIFSEVNLKKINITYI